MRHFHAADGSGYSWLADRILEVFYQLPLPLTSHRAVYSCESRVFKLILLEQVDKINPQNAARLTSAFSSFRRYDTGRQALIRSQLQRVLDEPSLSKFTFEIASRSLKG